MMQCGTCNHWVHAKCEDLTGDFYSFIFLRTKVVTVNAEAVTDLMK